MSVREIVLIPYKIDKEGTIHITPMARTEHKGYVARMKRLVAMGIFTAKDVLEIKEGEDSMRSMNKEEKQVFKKVRHKVFKEDSNEKI